MTGTERVGGGSGKATAAHERGNGPIFVVGAPRSGTTLLRAILNRHPRIGLCDETFFFYWVVDRARVFGDLGDTQRRARAVAAFLETRRVRRLELDLDALREHLEREATSLPRFLRALLEFYARARGKPRGGEKTPQHALVATTLLQWYPDARLVHLVRDPRDVAASLKRMPWGGGSALLDAKLWSACVAGAEACGRDPRAFVMKYESLIADPAGETARLCAFLDEEYSPALLESTPGSKSDRWWFERAHGKLETTRVERWRQELDAGEIAVVEWIAGERLERYGYTRSAPAAGAGLRARARAGAALASLLKRVRHLPALWYRWMRPDRLAAEEAVIDAARDREEAPQ